MKVFLGGTCNNSTWRERLIKDLEIDYFNPVVDDWTSACQAEEIKQRKSCDYCLYVITSDMTGVYSIAEVIDDSNKRPLQTIFCFLDDGFDAGQIRSLEAVGTMAQKNGAKYFRNLKEVSEHLNGYKAIHDFWDIKGSVKGEDMNLLEIFTNQKLINIQHIHDEENGNILVLFKFEAKKGQPEKVVFKCITEMIITTMPSCENKIFKKTTDIKGK